MTDPDDTNRGASSSPVVAQSEAAVLQSFRVLRRAIFPRDFALPPSPPNAAGAHRDAAAGPACE